ncbi:MAG: DUF427 domain-containing protein [Xanthomonadaceae bacterium]|nr:DUF427 domain-containing protein [Xanthomonadaceae bacterium]MDE2278160.1 DUF427 domain-containing protein [Xanthomonadaceae bacterium]MDE2316536.1 DUF427 domain-containing protein [Xanthomonadaceae bacterium]
MRAIWKDQVIAESDHTIKVEGSHYFPPQSLKHEYLRDSSRQSVCPWKGTASYFDVAVGAEVNPAAAWYYPAPKAAAADIRGYVAFRHGVIVQP